jgi:hypothetical protein
MVISCTNLTAEVTSLFRWAVELTFVTPSTNFELRRFDFQLAGRVTNTS